jgi:glycerophosphoryl diester phosphodiesterase
MNKQFICFAHRGASGHEPENTEISFEKAIELGSSWIELDVRAVEGRGVIFHDRDLKRIAGVKGLLRDQTLSKLASVQLPKDQRIPLLSETLNKLQGRVSLQVELKGSHSGAVAAKELNTALNQGWRPESLLVSSFDHEELFIFKNLAPLIPIGVLIYGYPLNCLNVARRLGAVSVHINTDSISQRRIAKIHQAGFKVYVYTVDDPDEIRLLKSWGVDGIFSNFPERVIATV